ncbi:MAG TPA: hypothetical protein EYP05_00945, partial [Piscirickettsiaceae bacterium]|nr:hypothetical protein [Piscirickettsiaceae bacterium]
MKLGKQGEIRILPESSALVFESKPTEINKQNGKEPFNGQLIVQPHSIKIIWDVLEGRKERVKIKSGQNVLSVIYQAEKNRVRLRFYDINGETESSYIVFGNALNKLKDEFLKAIRNSGIISVGTDSFSAMRIGDKVILKNGFKEYYLDKEEAEKLIVFILNNYILKEPV